MLPLNLFEFRAKNVSCERLPNSLGIVPLKLQPISTLQNNSSYTEDGKSVTRVEIEGCIVHR